MTTLEQDPQKLAQPYVDQKTILRQIVWWIIIVVAMSIAMGSALWVWQNGIGNTFNSLPVVESMQGDEAQSDSTTSQLSQEDGVDGTSPGQERANRVGVDRSTSQQPDATQAGAANPETASRPQRSEARGLTTDAPFAAEQVHTSTSIVAIVGTADAQLLSADTGDLLEALGSGTPLHITHRSEDGQWLYVNSEDRAGWVESAAVLSFGMDKLLTMPFSVAFEASASRDAVTNDTAQPLVTDATIDVSTAVSFDDASIQTVSTTDLERDAADVAEAAPTEDVQTQPVESIIGTVTLTSSRLNVRSAPTTSSTIVAKAYPAEEYVVLAQDESGDWIQIALADGEFGWISAAYMAVSVTQETMPISTETSELPAFEERPATEEGNAATNTETVSVATTSDTVSAGASGLSGTLALHADDGLIYLYDLQTGNLSPLTDGFDPAISPDGSAVAFTRDGGQHGVYVINVDGSNERLLFSGRERLASPKWSSDGSEILFTYRTESLEEVVGGARGGGAIVPTIEYDYHLAVVDLDGENYRDVPALNSARAADWTDSGIVYQSSAGIQIIDGLNDTEGHVVRFDNLDPFDYDPDWQPNGGQIAFMKQGASHWEIYVVNPDGTGLNALTRPVTALVDALPSNVAPAYSPDGEQIVYLSNLGADNSAGAWQIWVMDADGSNARPLPIDVTIDYSFGSEQVVSWGLSW